MIEREPLYIIHDPELAKCIHYVATQKNIRSYYNWLRRYVYPLAEELGIKLVDHRRHLNDLLIKASRKHGKPIPRIITEAIVLWLLINGW